jgi:hypothetical protein
VCKGSHAGEMCGFEFLRNCTGSAYVEIAPPSAIKARDYPFQLVCSVSVDGVTPLLVVLKTIMYWYWLKLKGCCTSKNIAM